MPTTRPQSERSATYLTTDYHIGLVGSSYTGWSGLVYQTNISSYPALCMAMRTWPKISIMIIALFQTEFFASRFWLADSVTEGSDLWLVNIDLNLNGFLSLMFLILVHCSNPYQITFICLTWRALQNSMTHPPLVWVIPYDSYHTSHIIWLITYEP